MEMVTNTAIDYFSASEHYFWRWAEHGRVIEFANGRTICYREELTYLLGELPPAARFPLGSVLLVLCACKENWESLFEVEQQLTRLSLVQGFTSDEYISAQQMKQDALGFLSVVNSLPAEARTGMRRTALIAGVISGLELNGSLPEIHKVVKELATGELDDTVFAKRRQLAFETVARDLGPLAQAHSFFPDKDTLALMLRTGLTVLPERAPLALPEERGANLLGQLHADIKTRLLSGLARKILAAIRIPMHLAGSSEQSLGGVADISNRGPYDKLLLSELAQDDHLLTARLANNEALFLQRETTPDNAVQELGVFMDVTLKMWGLPRIIALATALAFREGKERNQKLQVWAIGGNKSGLQDMDSKAGIIAGLEELDPALDCAATLLKTVRELVAKKGKYVLITGEGYLQDPAMSVAFHKIRDELSFLVTAGHDGHIRLYKLGKGQQRLLNEATIDPFEDLGLRGRKNRLMPLAGLPAIMQQPVFPLYYPSSKVKMNQQSTFVTADKTIVVITQDRRVLYWPVKGAGAVELVDALGPGAYGFGESHEDVYILLYNTNVEMLQVFALNFREMDSELFEVAPRQKSGYSIKFINHCFYLYGRDGLDILDPVSMAYETPVEGDVKRFNEHHPVIRHYKNFNALKKQINSGYSVINSAKSVYIHTAGKLFMDKRVFTVENNNFYWKENSLAAVEWVKPVKEEQLNIDFLPNVKFTRYTWRNGSEAMLDSRGMLHLKSHDGGVGEICVLLVVDQATACWSADGVVSGPPYFTGKTNATQTEPLLFYKRYIQPFLDTLK